MNPIDPRPSGAQAGGPWPNAREAPARPTVLAVDDTPANLNLLSQLLGRHYRVQVAVSGSKALELARRQPPDIVVLDVMMPGMDGFEVCRSLKADARTRDVPVIFLTALNGVEDETQGFAVGGADFVAKPFTPATLQARVQTQLELKAWRDALRDRNAWLQRELDARLEEVERLRDTSLFVMVALAEFRDTDTGNHLKRTEKYVGALARWLADHDLAPPEWRAPGALDELAKAAPLHDIGKINIPDRLLLKEGPLDAGEWVEMKQHAAKGADLLQRAADKLGDRAGPLLRYAIQIARWHHERWDGSGYPDGLSGEAIPLPARLMAVADVYDALISRRPYKPAMSHEVAIAAIEQGAGAHFDPTLVRAVRAMQAQMKAIAEQHPD